MGKHTETATFAAGCFWGVEDSFRKIKGVLDVEVGYTGGHTADPTYKQVCTGATGHAEAAKIIFDPDIVSYDELVKDFFKLHDPTTPNRQGPDVGSQYRSAIFYHTAEQQKIAELIKEKTDHSGKYGHPVVTEVVPAGPFYRAEEYHQRYFEKNGGGVCHA
jgi:methionine-S-sulfoxide reductase